MRPRGHPPALSASAWPPRFPPRPAASRSKVSSPSPRWCSTAPPTSGEVPRSICEVVTQPAQFSFVRDEQLPGHRQRRRRLAQGGCHRAHRGRESGEHAFLRRALVPRRLRGAELGAPPRPCDADRRPYLLPSQLGPGRCCEGRCGRRSPRVHKMAPWAAEQASIPAPGPSPDVADRQAPAALPVLGAASDARKGLTGRGDAGCGHLGRPPDRLRDFLMALRTLPSRLLGVRRRGSAQTASRRWIGTRRRDGGWADGPLLASGRRTRPDSGCRSLRPICRAGHAEARDRVPCHPRSSRDAADD